MCNCDCIQNPYYQDLVVQKACENRCLPCINVEVYPETQKCSPCQNRDNYKCCGFPTWTQFDQLDCTFKGLNRTYGKLVPQRMMSDVMIPGPRVARIKKSQSETKVKRVPCKKKGMGGNRGSDTQLGGKSGGGGGGGGGGTKSKHPGKNVHFNPDKGGHKTVGSNGGSSNGKGSKQKGTKNGKKSKGKGGDQSKDTTKQNGDTDPDFAGIDGPNGADGTHSKGPHSGGPHSGGADKPHQLVYDENGQPILDLDGGPNTGYGYGPEVDGMENIIRQTLMNSGILTLTPLRERDGQHYLNFNIKNDKPNPDLNLDINVDDYLFETDNKLTTEIRYRLIQTFEDAV